ncbi:MAG: phosphoenolpyruvate--protein phosphotransferase [Bacillota bacterium]|nr:phosphoenolpyruvate--protein phosphotransferase [Bacillota bacterium]HHU62289.1 phosphoenolpyruvate--protein phosphotransferase [Natronincola sp.]
MAIIKGIGASKGIGIGKVFIKKDTNKVIEKISVDSIELEIQRVNYARLKAISQLTNLQEKARINIGEDESAIFKVHQMMLDDQDFIDDIEGTIADHKVNAEYAVAYVKDQYVAHFSSMKDPYLRERVDDIIDICRRLLSILTGNEEPSLARLTEKSILVAKDLLPSDTVQMERENILGILTEKGGATSHTSILARTMQIPAVVGIDNLLETIQSDDEVIVDGTNGAVIINPDQETKDTWELLRASHMAKRKKLQKLIGTESITKDGVKIRVAANIGAVEEVDTVLENDGEGIGLFRSEFLYMDSQLPPDEETQYRAYRAVLEKMRGKPVTIRTLDIGGDKEVPYLHIPKENNPFLGYRAIRVSLTQTDVFKTQIKALLRASAHGSLGIMFPMISTLDEVKQAKEIVEEVKQEMIEDYIPFSPDVKIGIMIEIPAAAIISDQLAKEVDFFSIGTNDLTQYTMAADRMNAKVAHWHNPRHPAVLSLIKQTIENAHRENIKVGICGEAAADLSLTETFLAMGIDELSVNAGSILEVREKIQSISFKEIRNRSWF